MNCSCSLALRTGIRPDVSQIALITSLSPRGERISGVHDEFTPAGRWPKKPALSCVYALCAILGLNQSRLAIHAAGGNTPGWDGMIPKLLETEEFQSTVMPSTWRQVHVV
jgi:hypothetical protein